MLILSEGIIRIDGKGNITMEGIKRVYEREVERFLRELMLRKVTIRYRGGRLLFTRNVDPSTQQKIRNFLVNIKELTER